MATRIRYLRWWICGLLCLATTINYLDRSTLSVLKKTIADDIHMTDDDYANIVIAFMLAYAFGQMIVGKLIDVVGTRWGYLLAFIVWSLASMAHAAAGSVVGLAICRFILGAGEAGNFPAAIKAISEWFPKKERAFATGLMNVGCGVGAMIAPWIIFAIMDPAMLGLSWRESFAWIGAAGFVWVGLWLWLYKPPEEHPRLAEQELQHIRAGQDAPVKELPGEKIRWRDLFKHRQLWGIVCLRLFSDPVWWFWIVWFPGYLQTHRGFTLADLAAFSWIPFFTSDFGSLAGGGISTWFAYRTSSIVKARLLALACCASVMPLAIWAGLTTSSATAILLVSIVTFAHQAWSASALTLPADVFPSRYVGSVYGITAMAGALGGIVSSKLIGHISTNYETFVPMFVAAGLSHIIGLTCAYFLIRQPVAEMSREPVRARVEAAA
ncbi:MAG TPA: MFS transporter [Planctomycetota bacterium]|nr:MFS transporter [Planctomycetota bacterium]